MKIGRVAGGVWGRKIFPSEENFARVFGVALFAYIFSAQAKNHARLSQKNAPLTPATMPIFELPALSGHLEILAFCEEETPRFARDFVGFLVPNESEG